MFKNWIFYVLILVFSCTNTQEDSEKLNHVSNISNIYITSDSVITFEKKSPILIYFNDTSNIAWEAVARCRGGFTAKYPKHSYSIDFKDSVKMLDKKLYETDWRLISSYNDKSFIRHTLSYGLFRDLNPKNKSPHFKYYNLFLNYKPKGLYILMEKMGKAKFEQNENTVTEIYKDPHVFRKRLDSVFYNGEGATNFHRVKYPKNQIEKLNLKMDTIRTFMLKSSKTDFNKKIPEIFDLNSIIDWHLHILITNNGDGISKNFYLYQQNEKYKIALWDCDNTFGRDGDNEKAEFKKAEIKNNILIDKLLEYNTQNYKEKLKAKFNSLVQNKVITPDQINTKIESLINLFESGLEQNFKIWPVNSKYYMDEDDFVTDIIYIKGWYKKHFEYCQEYINSL